MHRSGYTSRLQPRQAKPSEDQQGEFAFVHYLQQFTRRELLIIMNTPFIWPMILNSQVHD